MDDTKVSFNFSQAVTIGKASSTFNGKVTKDLVFTIAIEDENLKNIILSTIGKTSRDAITKNDAEVLTELNAANLDIKSLSGLEFFKNLSSLNLSGNHLTDTAPLKNLSKINSLNLSNQVITLPCEDSNGKASADVNLSNAVISNINNNGLYNEEENSVKWNKLTSSRTLSYDFEKEITIGNNTFCLNGTVNKDITIKPVTIADDNLRDVILNILHKNSDDIITEGDVLGIKDISAENKNIISLDGLENFKNLESINLSANNIRDISPLKSLGKLNSADVSNRTLVLDDVYTTKDVTIKSPVDNSEISFTDVNNNAELKSEFNNSTSIINHSGTITLKAYVLNKLFTDNNLYSEITKVINKSQFGIEELLAIRSLNLANKDIYSIEGLQYLTNLEALDISGNHLTDISLLNNIESLKADNQSITLPSEISKGRSSAAISIDNAVISNISCNGQYNEKNKTVTWNKLKESTVLSFNYTVGQLKGTVSKEITINPITIEDLNLRNAILNKLEKDTDEVITKEEAECFTTLDLSNKGIKSIKDLVEFKNLANLNLSRNEIADISWLSKLEKLETADISNQVINAENYYTNNKVSVVNRITSIDGSICTNIKTTGEYDDTINWSGINKDTTLSYSFTDNKDNRINYSGKVMIDVKYFNDCINDETLGDSIIAALGKDINEGASQEELDSIKTLDLADMNIYSIKGISTLKGLQQLDLSNNHIIDISELQSLKKLQSADITNQTYILNDQKTNLRPFTTNIVNPAISYKGSKLTSITNISNDGTYVARTNKILWKNLYETTAISFEFKETTPLINNGQCIFTGRVSKNIIFK